MKVPCASFLLILLAATPVAAQPVKVVDLADVSTDSGALLRVRGASGSGSFGVPLAGGFDVDGDGFADFAVSYMTASPSGRTFAGEVDLVFGDGTIRGEVDTAVTQERVLRIFGDQAFENAGSEIWMDDVTGDGLGDLLICRQNFDSGAGALTILAGGGELRTFALGLQPFDLRSPAPELTVTTFVGAAPGDRLCIWARTGDVTGDTVADIVVGADQQNAGGGTHSGAVYVLMGGAHLATGDAFSLANLANPTLAGRVAHVAAPAGADHYHFGATCQIADLDGNGAAEVLAAATLNRAGASLSPASGPASHGSGGALHGRLYVLWDDNFTPPWPTPFEFGVESPSGGLTILRGGLVNRNFGEEILGGLDYDGDGAADLFVGDLAADATPAQNRSFSGVGYVFYQAAALEGLDFDIDAPPGGVAYSTILGPSVGAIGADTAAHGDFDGDGTDDLAYCSPEAAPQGRVGAGTIHVLRGRDGGWPALIDTASLPPASLVEVAEIQGAHGQVAGDKGDVLCYSGTAGDIDGDGATDLIVNEMLGNGSSTVDVGNLLVIDGPGIFGLFRDGFESGDTSAWTLAAP